MYSAPDKVKERDREKHKRDIKDLLTARGKQGTDQWDLFLSDCNAAVLRCGVTRLSLAIASSYRQLFAFALIPIFNEDRTLMAGDDLPIKPLFRPAKGELHDSVLLGLMGERGGSMSLKRTRALPGHLTVSLTELLDVPTKRFDVSLEGCGGAVAGDDSPLEMQEFTFVPRVTPHIFLVNNVYLYLVRSLSRYLTPAFFFFRFLLFIFLLLLLLGHRELDGAHWRRLR